MYNYPNYGGFTPQQQYQPQQFNYQAQPQPQVQTPVLYGKYVDSIDVVRGIDIPIGNVGYYPTADGTKIFSKSWNNDGTTKIDEYQKVASNMNRNSNDSILDNIYKSLDELSKKIDTIQKPTVRKKKTEADEYYEQ